MVVLGLMLVGVSGATWAMLRGGGEQEESVQRDLRTVERGRFDVVIPASGELAALKQIEIVNALEAKAVVTEIIPEGSREPRREKLIPQTPGDCIGLRKKLFYCD